MERPVFVVEPGPTSRPLRRGSFMAEDDSSPQQALGELFELTKAYAKQEAVDPVKGLGKFIALGIASALTGAVSIGLLVVGVLRLLQTETGVHLTGKLSWVPYLGTLIIASAIAAIAISAISSKKGPSR